MSGRLVLLLLLAALVLAAAGAGAWYLLEVVPGRIVETWD